MAEPSGKTWKIAPAAWVPIGLAVAAEAVSNGLRAYALGSHLDRLSIELGGRSVSLAGGVLVLAALAISLAQARAAWVALTPGPVRIRIIAGAAAVLLLAVSATAMASHILEAQRAKLADEGGARGRYDRSRAAYDAAASELAALGSPRPVPMIQAEVSATRIDAGIWRRSQQCADISRDDTRAACEHILTLYKERGAAARKAELEPEVARLRNELAALDRPEVASASESALAGVWGWLMGASVVFVATFGAVLFARPDDGRPANDNGPRQPVQPAAPSASIPRKGKVAATVKAPSARGTKIAPAVARSAGQTPRDWAATFRQQHGRAPQIGELQSAFPEVPKTSAWRICKAA